MEGETGETTVAGVLGEVGGRRKWIGTAVGDSVDRRMDERRDRWPSLLSPSGRARVRSAEGDVGLLWDETIGG